MLLCGFLLISEDLQVLAMLIGLVAMVSLSLDGWLTDSTMSLLITSVVSYSQYEANTYGSSMLLRLLL